MMPHVSLEPAIGISEAIITALEQVDLEAVEKLYARRQAIIDRYYRDNQSIDGELTIRLQELNAQIVTQLEALKHNTRSQQLELNQSSKASRAYLDIAAE